MLDEHRWTHFNLVPIPVPALADVPIDYMTIKTRVIVIVLPFWRRLGEKKRHTHLRLRKTKECDCRICFGSEWSTETASTRKQARTVHVLTACAKLWSSTMSKPVHACCVRPGVAFYGSSFISFIFLYPAVSDLQASGLSSAFPHSISGPRGDMILDHIGPILSSEDTEESEDASRVSRLPLYTCP